MTFAAILSRATARILAHATAGEDVVLRGEVTDPPRDINIQHGVEMLGEYGTVVAVRSVATINVVDTPAKGNTLAAAGKTYVLDGKIEDNGFSQRWTLLET